MAGGRYPKPDDQKVNRVQPVFGWVDLPPERKGDPPPLPDWRTWDAKTLTWWATLWSKPQANMWDATGSSLWTLACLIDDLVTDRAEAVKISAEARQIEDRHGLNPKSLLQLRWRLGGFHAEATDEEPPPKPTDITTRRKRLKIAG